MHLRRFTLPTFAATGALAVVGLTAGAASGHVTVTPSTTEAGAYTVLTFSVGHGCEGSPTTGLTIRMPESIPQVTPTISPSWTIRKVTEQLPAPVKDAHGNELTERVSEVRFTARTPLPDGYRDTVELSVKLPDSAGETLTFPVVQTCAKGETGWVETAAAGQDPEELEHPAPVVEVSEAAAATGASKPATEPEADDDGDSDATGATGIALGAAGLAVGGVALARTRKRG